MTDLPIIDDLKALLSHPLPGWSAQSTLMPEGRHRDGIPQDLKPAAVLVALYPHAEEWYFPMIKRSVDSFAHSGQIALPGGRQQGSESHIETALRETEEEIDLPADQIEILGSLSPLPIPVSRHLVHPIVGFSRLEPHLTPDPREVEQIFSVSLTTLKQVETKMETHHYKGQDWQIPYFEINGHKVWGATAMILSEFREILSKIINTC